MLSLNVLLSSSSFPVLFFRQFFLFDFFEKLTVYEFNHFNYYFFKLAKPFLKVRFDLILPFSNDLSKFRNRVLVLLYFFVFELLVGVKPQVVPVLNKKVVIDDSDKLLFKKNKVKAALLGGTKIAKFVFYKDLNFFQSSFFLTIISCFLSRHSFSSYTVPSKLLKVVSASNSYCFNLSSGLGSLDFLSQFDDFILSRVLLSFSFVKVKFLPNQIFDYYLSALGLNLFRFDKIGTKTKDFNLLEGRQGSENSNVLISLPAPWLV